MISKNNYYYIFSTCIFVKGAKRGIIYDLQREDYEYVPLSMIELFNTNNGNKIKSLYKNINDLKDIEIIDDYLEFLIEKDFIFLSKIQLDKSLLPPFNIEYKSPNKISNIILDVSEYNIRYLKKIEKDIEILGCGAILFRVLNLKDIEKMLVCLSFFSESSCRAIYIHCIYFPEVENYMMKFMEKNKRIIEIVVFNSHYNKRVIHKKLNFSVIYTTHLIEEKSKNIVSYKNFYVNQLLYLESNTYNNYYNGKIYIDYEALAS